MKTIRNLSLSSRINLLVILVIALASVSLSYSFLPIFADTVEPQINRKAMAVGESLRGSFIKAIQYDIPLAKLENTAVIFDQVLDENREMASILFVDKNGQILFKDSKINVSEELKSAVGGSPAANSPADRIVTTAVLHGVEMPVIHENRYYGKLFIQTDPKFYHQYLQNVVADIITVILLSFIFALEMLYLTVNLLVTEPARAIERVMTEMKNGNFTYRLKKTGILEFTAINKIINGISEDLTRKFQGLSARVEALKKRLPESARLSVENSLQEIQQENTFIAEGNLRDYAQLQIKSYRAPFFIFIYAHMLCLSFIPILSSHLYRPSLGFSKDLLSGLPISAFMLFWALAMPMTSIWLHRFGRRRFMLMGITVSTISLFLTAFAHYYELFILLRCLSAVGFGMVFLCVQEIFLDRAQDVSRAVASANFWAAFFSGTVCGSGMGGILADRVGYDWTFALAAAAAGFSGIFFMVFVKDEETPPRKEQRNFTANMRSLIGHGKFSSLVLLLSIPGKVVLTGFLYFLVPVALYGLGATQSLIGRVIMIFSLALIFVGPFFTRNYSRHFSNTAIAIFGSVMAGISITLTFFLHTIWGMILGVTFLGIFRSIYLPSVDALVLESFGNEDRQKIGTATILSIYGLFEKIGNVVGPMLIGFFILISDQATSLLLTGILTTGCGILYGVVHLILNRKSGAYV